MLVFPREASSYSTPVVRLPVTLALIFTVPDRFTGITTSSGGGRMARLA